MKNTILKLLVGSFLSLVIAGCGGGGGGGPAAVVAPVTENLSNQLASSVSIGGYKSLSLAQTTNNSGSTVKTAFFKRFLEFASNLLIGKAYAQSSSCSSTTDVLKLVGIEADGTISPLNVTMGTDQCGVGFTDMFNSVNYILLVGEGIYKDGQTCNLVFLQKSNGSMYCVGEVQAARYKIKGSKNWGNYAVLQESANGNFMFLEATAQIFKNNVISGEITKILRFNLSDLSNGPQVTTVYEGYNTNWMGSYMSGNTSNEFEGFNVYGYVGLDNGNLAIQYYRYVSSGSSWAQVNRAQYVSFAADGTATKKTIDFSSLYNSNNGWNWTTIPCWLKKSSDPGRAYFVTYGQSQGSWGTTWGYGIYFVEDNANGTSVSPTVVQPSTALCQNSYAANTIARRGDSYYSVVTQYGYTCNQSGCTNTNAISLVSNDLSGSADTVTPLNSLTSQSYWGWNQSKIVSSKDYLYVTLPYNNWWSISGNNNGDSVIQIDPLSNAVSTVTNESNGYLIMSIDATKNDNNVKLTGRLKNSDDLDKFAGTITGGASPTFSVDTSSSSTYKPVTIIKL